MLLKPLSIQNGVSPSEIISSSIVPQELNELKISERVEGIVILDSDVQLLKLFSSLVIFEGILKLSRRVQSPKESHPNSVSDSGRFISFSLVPLNAPDPILARFLPNVTSCRGLFIYISSEISVTQSPMVRDSTSLLPNLILVQLRP